MQNPDRGLFLTDNAINISSTDSDINISAINGAGNIIVNANLEMSSKSISNVSNIGIGTNTPRTGLELYNTDQIVYRSNFWTSRVEAEPTGSTGAQGVKGSQGFQGAVGSTGSTGPTGAQGFQGPPGPSGGGGGTAINLNTDMFGELGELVSIYVRGDGSIIFTGNKGEIMVGGSGK